MWHYRPVEPIEERPEEILEDGHFWIREFVTGGVFGVRMADSGLLEMGGPEGNFDADGPWPYRRAVEAVRSTLDRDRLRDAVDDVTAYTFYVLAPLSMGVEYDWDAIPPVLGLEIWDGTADSFAPVDVTERVFEAIGLWSVPTIEKEVHARDLSTRSEGIPQSTYGTERAAGIVLRKKRGRALVRRQSGFDSLERVPPNPAGTPANFDDWLAETVQEATVAAMRSDSDPPFESAGLDELADEVAAELARRRFDAVGGLVRTDPDAFRQGVADRLLALRNQSTD